jgi:5'-nucleotidase
MRILVTNDDGLRAAGLPHLVRFCQQLGEVTTIVPLVEQSGKSHGIELKKPFMVHQVELEPGIMAYAVESTPADCVRYGVLAKGMKFDLVISGINRGFNLGVDSLYSGTVAAVKEAALLGIPAIALSTSLGYYDRVHEQLERVFDFIRDRKLLDRHSLYNINIPQDPKGFRITRQGGAYYSDDFKLSEDGMCTPNGICVHQNGGDLTLDTDATVSGYISILPMTTDLTAQEIFRDLLESQDFN